MKEKKLSKIVVGICLVLVLALALPLTSACAPEETPATTPTPTPTTTPTPTPTTTPTSEPAPTPTFTPPASIPLVMGSTGAAAFAAGTAMTSVIGEKAGVKFPVVPGPTAFDRGVLLKDGRAEFAWMPAVSVWGALLGELDFVEWEPESFRTAFVGGNNPIGIPVRGDSGIETWADLTGKRVATYPTYPTMQLYMDSGMAFANLSWDDVRETPVSGYSPGRKALIEGAVDASFFAGTTGDAFELASSIHGIHWLASPASDTAGWARLNRINPAFFPLTSTISAGASEENPVEIWGYDYQIVCYDTTKEAMVHWFIKEIVENYDAYKDHHAWLPDWTLENALGYQRWVAPYHDGSIRYFKDVGAWTAEMEAKQQELLALYPQTGTR